MRRFRDYSLSVKMNVIFSTIAIVVISLILLIIGYNTTDMASKNARQTAREMAFRYGNRVEADIEAALVESRAIASLIEGSLRSPYNELSRNQVNDMLKHFIE